MPVINKQGPTVGKCVTGKCYLSTREVVCASLADTRAPSLCWHGTAAGSTMSHVRCRCRATPARAKATSAEQRLYLCL